MASDPYNTLGFMFVKNRPKDLNEYSDFYYKNWDQIELVSGLRYGILPTGLLLRNPYKQILVVMHSKLYSLTQDMKIIHP